MKKISQIKSSTFSRGLFAAKSALRVLPSVLSGEEDPRKLLKNLVGQQIEKFVNDVGELKGSLLKAAQILSLYGEYYLPAEINETLKSVQSQNHFLDWEKVKDLIPAQFHRDLTIDQTPIAAASIGQVHRARIKKTGEEIVLKIQYPGVKKAIDLDIKMIKTLLGMGKFLPKKMNMDGIYEEIKRVLLEEMDYRAEIKKHEAYRELMENVEGVYVPKVYQEYGTDSIIASEFIPGRSFSELAQMGLSQEERDNLGRVFLRLFFQEIFRGDLIQTDCHPGNFLFHDGKVVLIDFGATLFYPSETLRKYRALIRHAFLQEREKFFEILHESAEKVELNEDLLWEYCLLASSPLQSRDFDWGATTLPDEVSPKGIEVVKSAKIERPPHEFIFLDRKLLGLFSILRSLKSRFNVQEVASEFLS